MPLGGQDAHPGDHGRAGRPRRNCRPAPRIMPLAGQVTQLLAWNLPEKPYDHHQIELKWFERWQNADFYKAEENSALPKFYVLEMLPYPSGTLHIGHIRNYSIGDALARYKWMRGFNVLHPMGWDAFGLPAENAAIANRRPPREWTLQNIDAMKKTHRRFGFSYDWDREVSTYEPEYYHWNQ